uniref:Zinc finger protein 64 n=1 Tax=Cacopsylla melanoneura TaxID=428564 RepID=A0A8D9APG6_9HEMI
MIECKYCNQKLANYLDILLGHSNSCPSIKDAKRDKVAHMCCRCSFSSGSNENLKIHLKSHFDEKIFRCPLCSFCTALIGSLKLHIMKDHVSLNPLSCPLCGYVCKKPNGLSIHMKSHVQDIADFKVPVMKKIPGVSTNCPDKIKGEDYPELAKLSDQNQNPVNVSTMKLETAVTSEPLPENTSQGVKKQKLKHITSPMRLKQHKKLSLLMKKADRSVLLEKQRKGIRMDKISCKYCSKKVIRDVNKIHEHSMKCPNMEKINKKSFMCCSCDYSSSYLGLLNTHILTVHSRIEDKPHKCDLCEFRTAYSQSLVIHFRTHTGEKPFECSACNFKCTTSSSLKSHVKIHHEKHSRAEKLISVGTENKQLHGCNYCAFKAKKLGTLNRHVNSQHPQYKHLETADQSSRNITEMLQIEMNTESVPAGAESEVKYHARSSEEKTSFFQFLNLETRTNKTFSNNETALNLSHHQDPVDPSVSNQ